MVALSFLPTSAGTDLATLNSCRPPEPPEPPDPPDTLLPSPPSLAILVSWRLSSPTPVLATGSPLWSLSLAGKGQSIHILPILHHCRTKPMSSLDRTGSKSESARCRISPPDSVSLRLRARDSVSHLLARRLRRPTSSPPPRTQIPVPSIQIQDPRPSTGFDESRKPSIPAPIPATAHSEHPPAMALTHAAVTYSLLYTKNNWALDYQRNGHVSPRVYFPKGPCKKQTLEQIMIIQVLGLAHVLNMGLKTVFTSMEEFISPFFHLLCETGRILFPLLENGRIPELHAGIFKVTMESDYPKTLRPCREDPLNASETCLGSASRERGDFGEENILSSSRLLLVGGCLRHRKGDLFNLFLSHGDGRRSEEISRSLSRRRKVKRYRDLSHGDGRRRDLAISLTYLFVCDGDSHLAITLTATEGEEIFSLLSVRWKAKRSSLTVIHISLQSSLSLVIHLSL
ncbi:unnamed protein product [Arabis nemorensis]|uniref:Uncharacterized protein n=1 Tax=Arabis nemorensis TaxID=586526 RepID=A0A565C9N4_9BRAS|nr:unnamed protein product [Arabis nemorensis]